jgi:sterol 14-demethylase
MCSVNGWQEKLYEEQRKVMGDARGAITLEDLEKMPLLHACTRETLRMRPPIMQMMRKVRKTFTVKANGREYVIPKGNEVCVSPSVNGRNPDEWKDPEKFDPTRFLKTNADGSVEVTHGEHLDPDDAQKKFKWVPFGAGRHRCIGFEFAQVRLHYVCHEDCRFALHAVSLPTHSSRSHCLSETPKQF